MTQVFTDKAVVPVTAIDISNWFVTHIKTKDADGYDAVQIGRLRNRYINKPFSADWLKKPKTYFYFLREIKVDQEVKDMAAGDVANLQTLLTVGDFVDVTGRTKGCGFAGVVKRHNFNGPPASHGATMGKRTGSLSFMRSRGRVIKGKRMPGHMGFDFVKVKALEVVRIEPEAHVVLVKGSVPGKTGSLLFLKKA